MAVPLLPAHIKLPINNSSTSTPMSAFRPLSSSKSHPSLSTLIRSPSNKSVQTVVVSTPPAAISPSSSSSSSFTISPIRKQAAELCTLGIRSFQRLDYWTAISQYTLALDLVSDDYRTWNNRGIAYSAAKLYRMGIYDYNEAIRLAPKVAEFYYQRGVAWSALRDFSAAINDYTECLSLKKDHADAYNNRGNAYRNLQKFDLAQSDLEAATVIDPSNALYSKNLNRVVKEKEKIAEEEKAQEKSRMAEVELLLQSVISAKLNGNITLTQKSENGVDVVSESLMQSILPKKEESTSKTEPATTSASLTSGTSLAIMSNLSTLPPEFVSQLINILKEVQNTSSAKSDSVRKSPDHSSSDEEDNDMTPTKRAKVQQTKSSSSTSLNSLTSFSDVSESTLSPNSTADSMADDSSDELLESYPSDTMEMETCKKQIPDLKFSVPTILKNKVSNMQ